ncbi:hypothetical protein B0H12DRAFT_604635 [Mycena haematopus]|nr:hypothetical protein B0H12DRAFT_604635 [Mycena haematopus]
MILHIQAPNGKQLCPSGRNSGPIRKMISAWTGVPITMVKTISRQLIMTTDMIHTDIKSNNILFTLPEAAPTLTVPTIHC